jgi:hypothetical protein
MRKVDRLANRDGATCWLCKEPVEMKLTHPDPMSPTCDHFVPRGNGGINAQLNLRLAHARCNYYRAVLFPKSLVFTEDEIRKFSKLAPLARMARGPRDMPIGGRTDVVAPKTVIHPDTGRQVVAPKGYAKNVLADKPRR